MIPTVMILKIAAIRLQSGSQFPHKLFLAAKTGRIGHTFGPLLNFNLSSDNFLPSILLKLDIGPGLFIFLGVLLRFQFLCFRNMIDVTPLSFLYLMFLRVFGIAIAGRLHSDYHLGSACIIIYVDIHIHIHVHVHIECMDVMLQLLTVRLLLLCLLIMSWYVWWLFRLAIARMSDVWIVQGFILWVTDCCYWILLCSQISIVHIITIK